jgi:hypothetical protein
VLCCSNVFTSTKRIVGRVTASQIASASALVLLPLHIGLLGGISRTSSAERPKFSRPVVRGGAGFDPDAAGFDIREELQQSRSRQAPAQYRHALRVDPVHLEHRLRYI